MNKKVKKEKCNNCGGTGYIYPRPAIAGHEGYQTCPMCEGEGKR